MFYEVLLEKRASRYKDIAKIKIGGPSGRYILGGALAGGIIGRKTADEDHKTRDMLLGATAGGLLGAGASRVHKAIRAHKMKSDGFEGERIFRSDADEPYDSLTFNPFNKELGDYEDWYYGKQARRDVASGKIDMPEDPKVREAIKRDADIHIRNYGGEGWDVHPNDIKHLDMLRERELLRGGRNLALGAGAGLGLSKLRSRDKKKKRS